MIDYSFVYAGEVRPVWVVDPSDGVVKLVQGFPTYSQGDTIFLPEIALTAPLSAVFETRLDAAYEALRQAVFARMSAHDRVTRARRVLGEEGEHPLDVAINERHIENGEEIERG
jgi:hypothetical protein